MRLILKTPKFIKDLIKMFEYQEPVRTIPPVYKPKIVKDGCPYCGSPKFVQLTTRKLCTNCHETYNRMKSVKFDYKPTTGLSRPPEMTDLMKSMMKVKK